VNNKTHFIRDFLVSPELLVTLVKMVNLAFKVFPAYPAPADLVVSADSLVNADRLVLPEVLVNAVLLA
jgi:hypothetical protein